MKHQRHFELTHYEPAGKTVQQQLFQALEASQHKGNSSILYWQNAATGRQSQPAQHAQKKGQPGA
jgi:hypothetical protein